MPTYDYECLNCEHIEEHFHGMSEDGPSSCPHCGSINYKRLPSAAYGRMADTDWSCENNGKGRYISQMANKPNDPRAYCRSQGEAINRAERAGYSVEKA